MSLLTPQPLRRRIRGRVREIIPALLHDPSVRSSRRLTRLASWPLVVTLQLLGLQGKTRVAFLWSAPDADEVIDRYRRGYVLFGRPGARLAKLEWQSFGTRAIATGQQLKIPTRLRGVRRNSDLEVRLDQDFQDVAKACQEGRSEWAWLTDELIDVYRKLDKQGLVAAIGTHRDGRLVGGILGITVDRTFSIMSIFHRENHAGSIAMAALVDMVTADGRWTLIDFGNIKPHFERFGAVEVSEERFLELLRENSENSRSARSLLPTS